MSNFEKFTHRKTRLSDIQSVTITKNGIIHFNTTTMLRCIEKKSYVNLYYSKNKKMIGFEFTSTNTPETYTIRKARNEKIGSISGTSFLKYYSIPFIETKNYELLWDENEKMYVVDLNIKK